MSEPRGYPANVAGEAFYQPAIGRLVEGQVVHLVREIANPHDERALAFTTVSGETIGYAPRGSWLQSRVFEDGQAFEACVLQLNQRPGTPTAVVLDVWQSDEIETPRREWSPPEPPPRIPPRPPNERSWLSRLLG